jgi:hypothetical protein
MIGTSYSACKKFNKNENMEDYKEMYKNVLKAYN